MQFFLGLFQNENFIGLSLTSQLYTNIEFQQTDYQLILHMIYKF